MATSTIVLCELDNDQILGIAAGPTHADVIVTAHETGVFLYSSLSQEQKQEWPLSSSRLELSQAAAWDTRTQHLYTVAAVRSGAAQVAGRGPQQRLLGWPASYTGALEDVPLSMELHSAVHAVHPIFSAASAAPVKNPASAQTVEGTAADEQHNSSSATERESAQSPVTAQKKTDNNMQQTGALLHTKLPSIKTRLKQRPGKRKSGTAAAAAAAAATAAVPTVAELPWMQEWIATGRTAEDREAGQTHVAADASASGRSASAADNSHQRVPGVFVVHSDGSVNTDAAYSRHVVKQTNGSAEAQVLASAAAEGRLAVVTKSKKRRQSLHLYMLQGEELHSCGEFQLQLPEKVAEVVSIDVSENRLALLWSNGVLQCFSPQAVSDGQVSLRLQYQRKLAGFPEVVSEKIKQATATPKKRAAVTPAQPSAQYAMHGKPTVRLLGSGLLAVAARIRPDLTSQADQNESLAPSILVHASTQGATDIRSRNGPVTTPGMPLKASRRAADTTGKLLPIQQLQPNVLRVAVLDNTYGCVQHIRDLQAADLGPDADAPYAAPLEPKQLQIMALHQGSSIGLVLGLNTRALLLELQAAPVTLAGMVGALSLNRQHHPAASLQRQALDLQFAEPPVHSHFRPCWAQRGAAVGLPMLPHIGQVAVEVPTERLSRAEQEALQLLRQPGSLANAEAARSLVQDVIIRSQEHGSAAMSQELLQLVAEQCIEAGYWEALQLLAQQPHLSAFKALQGLLPGLAEHGQLLVLACALTQARDISPAHLGATLGVLLSGASPGSLEGAKQWSSLITSAADAAMQAAEASFGVEGAHEAALSRAQAVVMATDGFTAQELCLHAALAAGHDQAVLQAALRRLQQPQVMRLMGYLLKWVDRHSAGDEADDKGALAAGLALPSMEAVLRWACATLDTHFVTLAGLPARAQQQTLLSLHERIQQTLQMSQGIAALSGAMEHISSQAPLPTFSASPPQQYFVELLDLGVRAA